MDDSRSPTLIQCVQIWKNWMRSASLKPAQQRRRSIRANRNNEMAITLEDAKRQIDNAKAIIFDNDGTLVDTMPLHYEAWKEALRMAGISMTETQFYDMAGMPASAIIPALAAEQNVESFSETAIMHERTSLLKTALRKTRGVAAVLALCAHAEGRGLPMAVASGGERADVLVSLQAAGVDVARFAAVVTSEDVVRGKPHPETFITAAARLGVSPAHCLGLEDADKGLQALRAAGMMLMDVRRVVGYPLPACLRPAP